MATKPLSASTLNGYVEGKLERLYKERSLLKYFHTLITDNMLAVEKEIQETMELKEVASERLLSVNADVAILEAVKQLRESNEKKG